MLSKNIKIKKILIVGFFPLDESIYTYSKSFLKAFSSFGYIVDKFNYKKKFLNKWFVNYLFLKKVYKFNPDLIFFIKAENIFANTIKKLKNKGYLLINFYPDNPFSVWNGNSNIEVLKSLPFYDYFLSWSKMLMPLLQSAGCKKVYYFPFAYDTNVFDRNLDLTDSDKDKFGSDVCFVGTWEPDREKWLTELLKNMPQLNLAIWGNLWHENINRNSILYTKIKGFAVYNDDLVKAFRASKIILNFIRQQNMTSHNMRTFEVFATGSFLLTQRTKEQVEILFKENESIACFDSIDELVDKISFYLKNKEERKKIVLQGQERSKEFELKIVLKNFIEYIHKNLV